MQLKRIKSALKTRTSGPAAKLFKADIRSIFSGGPRTILGTRWFFGGGRVIAPVVKEKTLALFESLKVKFYDEENHCLNFNGIRIPIPNDSDIYAFTLEFSDLMLPYLDYKYDPKDLAFGGYSGKVIEDLKLIGYGGEGPYEYKEVTLAQGDLVIDAGANMGLFSAFARPRVGPNVYAFEPVPSILKILERTVELNGNDIKIVPLALSDSVGSFQMSINDVNIGAGSIVMDVSTGKSISIKTTTLDTFVHENNIKKVDFIKADIEGAERLLLKGAKNVLKEFAPKIAICTYHLPDDPKVLRELILAANSKYVIYENWEKMYAYVPK